MVLMPIASHMERNILTVMEGLRIGIRNIIQTALDKSIYRKFREDPINFKCVSI